VSCPTDLRRATRVAPVAGAPLATPWDRSRRAERERGQSDLARLFPTYSDQGFERLPPPAPGTDRPAKAQKLGRDWFTTEAAVASRNDNMSSAKAASKRG
jgi:hypothetical protein